MKNAVIVHGSDSKKHYLRADTPSNSNLNWLPWLQNQLLIRGIVAQTPEFPENYDPKYDVWSETFAQFTLTKETILVGHSCGAGFLLRWLSEHPGISVDSLYLVSPWMDPDKVFTEDFFAGEIDEFLSDRINRIVLFKSDDDFVPNIEKSFIKVEAALPRAEVIMLQRRKHFCDSEFPELLDKIIS